MKHHLVKNSEIVSCIYCSHDLQKAKWQSEFLSVLHYKTITCKCGKKNSISVKHLGSGHDEWVPGKFESLVEEALKGNV